MAPAEVYIFRSGIGPEYTKVHASDAQKFKTEEIEVEVTCQGFDLTEVDLSGKNLSFIVRHGGSLVSISGNVEEGKIRTFLKEKNDSVEITDRLGIKSSIRVTHTRHDGSTGEVG